MHKYFSIILLDIGPKHCCTSVIQNVYHINDKNTKHTVLCKSIESLIFSYELKGCKK